MTVKPVDSPGQQRRPGYPADEPRSYSTIERVAAVVREALVPGLRPDQPLPDWRLFERLSSSQVRVRGQVIPLDYDVVQLPFGTEAEARFDQEAGKIVVALSEETYEALERGSVRARFTLPHEIGHAVLHAAELVRLSRIPAQVAAMQRGFARHPIYQDAEWQANSFASACLMPARGLAELEASAGVLRVEEVRRLYLVSEPAARIRVETFIRRRAELV